jgi:hypothetical protein
MSLIGQRQVYGGMRWTALAGALCVGALAVLVAFSAPAGAGTADTCFGQVPRGGGPSAGDDVIIGTPDPDTVAALEGNDRVCGRAEGDTLEGNDGTDRLAGDAGNDELSGGADRDFLRGAFDDDHLFGNEADDELRGGRSDDTLNGGPGEDVCYGGPGVDVFISCEQIVDPDQPGAAIPETTITKRPKKTTTARKTIFKFTSDQPRSTFQCKLDKGKWKHCASPYKRWAKSGKHRFKVRAIDGDGDVDPTPAKRRWEVISTPRQ